MKHENPLRKLDKIIYIGNSITSLKLLFYLMSIYVDMYKMLTVICIYIMYTPCHGNIIRNHRLYADDIQLYISFKPCDSISRQTTISQVDACIKDIKTWMTNNLLKLNDEKTELIIITTSETTSRQKNIVINIGDSSIAPSMEPPRNHGVLFDSTCCLNDHLNKMWSFQGPKLFCVL